MDNSNAEFTAEEQAEFAKLEQESLGEALPISDHQANPPAADEQPAGNADEPKAEKADEPAQKEEATTDPAKKPEDDRLPGDLRHALRASRRAEKQARERAERLERENAELKAKAPAPADDAITDETLSTIEQDYPAIAPVVRALKSQVDAIAKAAPKPTPEPAQPAFEPQRLDDETQELVDSIPLLSSWHSDPEKQDLWEAVKAADRLLLHSHAWKGKTDAERAGEAVRRVLLETSEPKQPTAAEIAAAKVAAAKTLKPNGVSDIRGGGTTELTKPDYSRMTDDEIMASIPEH